MVKVQNDRSTCCRMSVRTAIVLNNGLGLVAPVLLRFIYVQGLQF
jgi:hypothetical protein